MVGMLNETGQEGNREGERKNNRKRKEGENVLLKTSTVS